MYKLDESYISPFLEFICSKTKIAKEYCKNVTEEVIERTI
jgi:hypothetical protein